MYKIESGIPMPGESVYGHTYPFKKMRRGESFMVRCKNGKVAVMRNRLSVAAVNSMGPGKFAVRKVEGGIRVWRVK